VQTLKGLMGVGATIRGWGIEASWMRQGGAAKRCGRDEVWGKVGMGKLLDCSLLV
jgi:hypothetical protein